MLGALGTGVGAGLGSMLGQAVDAPRNISWNLAARGARGLADVLNGVGAMGGADLGLDFGSGEAYGSGSEMMEGLFGMNPDDPLTQGLGFGAEALLDPTTLIGMAGGGKLGSMAGRALGGAGAVDRAGDAAGLAARLERMAGSGLGDDILRPGNQLSSLDEAMAGRGMMSPRQADIAPYMNDVDPLRGTVSPASMASGATRMYPKTDPLLAGQMEGMGLGQATGDTMGGLPVGFEMQAGLHPNMAHADRFGSPGVPPTFTSTIPGRPKAGAATLVGNPDMPFPSFGSQVAENAGHDPMFREMLMPSDVDLLRQQSQPIINPRTGRITDDIATMQSARDPFKALANQRYLGDQAALQAEMEAALGAGGLNPSLGGFPGPFTPQIPGVPDQNFLDQYGQYIAAGLLGGGVGSAYSMGQNRR